MPSSLRAAFNKAIPGRRASDDARPDTPDTDSDDELATSHVDKYRIRVTAGPSYDVATHRLVVVNGCDAASFENQFMRVKLKVRVRDYSGLPEGSPTTSPYFSDPIHKSDLYSISFSFVPKVTIPSLDTVWGNDFDRPIRDRLPPGFNTAFKIVKQFIDPGLDCDAYSDNPWILGPSLSCWFALRIGDNRRGKETPLADVLYEGADGNGKEVREAKGLPDASEKRRKHFLSESHRRDFEFEEGRQYQGDFYNPYIDFKEMALKLPGFRLRIAKYINDKTHTLRYVFKNSKTGDVYFVVVFTLLFGQELREALEADRSSAAQREKYEEHFGGVD